MVTFNLHYGQSRVRLSVRGRPVDMYHRTLSPKKAIVFADPDGGKDGIRLDADALGMVEVSDIRLVMSLYLNGWPLYIGDGETPIACEWKDGPSLGDLSVEISKAYEEMALVPADDLDAFDQVKARFDDLVGRRRETQAALQKGFRVGHHVVDLDNPPRGLVFPRPDLLSDDPFVGVLRDEDGDAIREKTGGELSYGAIMEALGG